MTRLFLTAALIAAIHISLFSQEPLLPGRFLPRPTEKGVGKIDTRIDNIAYWKKMADSGYVVIDPPVKVVPATYTGSALGATNVMTTDSPDVPVTSFSSTQSENSVFIKPSDEFSVLNSNNSTNTPVTTVYGANYFLSSNGGTTWGGSVNGAGGNNSGDPATAISLSGRMYVGFINSASGQSVAYSADGGSTWTPVVCGTYNGGLLDKNHMWIDNSSTSPYAGYVYSAWTNFGNTNTDQIEVTRSSNNGLTYSTPVNVSAGVAAGSHNQGVNLQTGPNGEVYAAWVVYDSWPSDEVAIGFNKSTNGGASYGTAIRAINNIKGIRNTGTSKNQRVNSFPSMAVDISTGSRRGNIYIVWTNIGVPGVNTGTDIDVYMIRSTNGGTSWSTPIRVNQDPGGLGKQHYFPWITCDPVTGTLSVIFYDDRNVSSTQCEVFCANSTDGGNTWENFKVSDVSFTPSPISGLATGYMGDYLGISAREGLVYPVWPDNRTGTVMTYCSTYDLRLQPRTQFTAATTAPCINETDQFTDQTTKSPTSWAWTITPSSFTYVNGTSATSQNPAVQFTANGSYTVRLVTSNANGSDTLVRTNYILVTTSTGDFTGSPVAVNVGSNVTFNTVSSCGIASYLWTFGAGASPATSTTAGPVSVTYSTTGLKDVSLTINGSTTVYKTNYIIVDASYCAASATTCDEYISNVTFGGINNSSGCTSGGYQKYTQYWTRVSPGISYPITVANGHGYSGDQCRTWIDWNQDLDFADAGETITMTGSPGVGPYTANITPPAGAATGATRMRIRIMWTGSVSSCGNATYGEVEDYTVYVGTPGLWEGGTPGGETDWNTANNWDDGRVPTSTTNVTIPDNVGYFPAVSGTYSCQNMLVKNGATVNVGTGAVLNITGDLTVGEGATGTLIINGGTCNVIGNVTTQPGGIIDVKNGGLLHDN